MYKTARILVSACLLAALAPTGSGAATFSSRDEALAKAFPDAEITRKSVVLTEEQLRAAEKLAGEKLPSQLVFPYEARRDGILIGTGYFDAHRVRTLPQTLLAIVSPEGVLVELTVLAFNEPPEYMAPEKWMKQFEGKILDAGLFMKKDIHGITGATLTARSTTSAARRILAIHQTLNPTPEHAP